LTAYIDELRDVIRRLHGAEATHVKTVPVKEVFEGQTVWDGNVEVFNLKGHAKAKRVYAWAHDTDDPEKPRRHVTVLHIPPVISAAKAVKASIIEEFRSGEFAAE
jgi:hypothetical protein